MDDFHYRPVNENRSTRRTSKEKIGHHASKFFQGLKLPNFRTPGGKIDWKGILLWIGFIIAGLFVVGFVSLILLITVASIGLPDINDIDKLNVAQSTTIYDREGNVLYVKHGGENRQYVAYDQISSNVVNATVAIEDDQYWIHPGFDLVGIARAAVNDVFHLSTQQGGSTITQQYIKNAFLSPEKSYMRKLKELILAVRLEQAYSKEKILELYFNKIPYGNNAFGIEKAAQIYFNRHARDLTLAESSVLASLPKGPSRYNPYGPHRNSELIKQFTTEEIKARNIDSEADLKLDEFSRGLIGKTIKLDDTHSVYIQGRTDLVLKAMVKSGYITNDKKDEALDELQKLEFQKYEERMQAAHFVFYVLEQLEEKYGKEIVEQGGLKVYTTLDPKLQEIGQNAVREQAAISTEKYNARNAGLISVDTRTGEILAMVGSKDYNAEDTDGAVNITTSYRQPGSSFKPFVYAQAFLNRYGPGTVIFDTSTRFGASHYPKNYDGKFRGLMSIRSALGQSRNIPAIKAFYLAGGQKPIMDLAGNMGINFTERDKTEELGWPLALGSAVVRPLDMAIAFSAFGNGGIHHDPVSILKVETANGEILEEWKADDPANKGTEALDPQVAYLITSILSDKSVGIGENLNVPNVVTGAKTGTSTTADNDKLPQDLWTVGYSTRLATAVWSGNNRPEDKLSPYADGYTASAPIWKKFMTEAHKTYPAESFAVPSDIKKVAISRLTGKLAGPETPPALTVEEVFASFSVPTEVDSGYMTAIVDTRNDKLANEYCPEDYVQEKNFLTVHDALPEETWEEGVRAWIDSDAGKEWIQKNLTDITSDITIGDPPTQESDLCSETKYNQRPEVKILSPKNLDEVESGSNLTVKVSIKAENGLEKVEFYLDDRLSYYSKDAPYDGLIRLPKGETGKTHHSITVKAIDLRGYAAEQTISISTVLHPSSNQKKSSSGTTQETTTSVTDPLSEPVSSLQEPLTVDLPLPEGSTI